MQAGERVLVAAGGAGGPGNAAVCRSKQRTLEAVNVGGATPSYETVELQLRLLADVGVVGFPNAGKSTLVSTISHANPKVACYPFTTLTPSVGTVPICRNAIATDAFTIADIPGIVVGSSNSCGLGSNFLRHIELTKVLLYLIDIAKIISVCMLFYSFYFYCIYFFCFLLFYFCVYFLHGPPHLNLGHTCTHIHLTARRRRPSADIPCTPRGTFKV
uniref:GTPase obg n=1 Tax=Lygus hesperus TaxID=30085 RepID=A0A0A9WSE1_LYGHE